jgi:HSP20 family protein
MPLCDLIDNGDKYELTLETPGIAKEKIKINATKNSIRVSGEQTEKTEEKRKNYLYNERSYKSFQRELPLPEEIIPKNIGAEMKNGVLHISIPKKVPTKPEETESVKIDVK